MHTIAPAHLLDLWDQYRLRPAAVQALALLGAAHPELAPDAADTPARWPMGRRNAALLQQRALLFGPQIEGVAVCPHCGERLELSSTTAELLSPAVAATWQEVTDAAAPLTVLVEGGLVRFRLPNSLDLLAVQDAASAAAAQQRLLTACLLDAPQSVEEDGVSELPAGVAAAVLQAMADADPQGNIEFSLCCPACSQAWLAPFDVAGFFWREIETWAVRILREVHELALAYGWREADILALSPQRRQAYLEMVRS